MIRGAAVQAVEAMAALNELFLLTRGRGVGGLDEEVARIFEPVGALIEQARAVMARHHAAQEAAAVAVQGEYEALVANCEVVRLPERETGRMLTPAQAEAFLGAVSERVELVPVRPVLRLVGEETG